MNELTAVVGPTPGAGHGECFVWSQDGRVVAVDAGGARSVGKYAGARKPEVLILSHDDKDHIGGAVALINSAKRALRQLWVPAEWAILIYQISRTTQATLLEAGGETVNVEEISDDIRRQVVELADAADGSVLTLGTLASAERNLSSWRADPSGSQQGFWMRQSSQQRRYWYGAKSLDEIIERVKKRAGALLRIFKAAHSNGVQLRFFSIDLALADARVGPAWETANAGIPGIVTLANAVEAPHAVRVFIPAGLPQAYALTRLTVQNRRALCTLLWSEPNTPSGGVMVWSDTDGHWLKSLRPRGFSKVTVALAASSAPHHASGNSAHDEVWAELRSAPKDLVVISAGGQRNQLVRAEYNALKSSRCCTWCRTVSENYQEVRASMPTGGRMSLLQKCSRTH